MEDWKESMPSAPPSRSRSKGPQAGTPGSGGSALEAEGAGALASPSASSRPAASGQEIRLTGEAWEDEDTGSASPRDSGRARRPASRLMSENPGAVTLGAFGAGILIGLLAGAFFWKD